MNEWINNQISSPNHRRIWMVPFPSRLWCSAHPDGRRGRLPSCRQGLLLFFVRSLLQLYTLSFSQESDALHLTAHNIEVDGVPAFDTNDLVKRHSKNREIYCVVGRADDQIILSTGEKVAFYHDHKTIARLIIFVDQPGPTGYAPNAHLYHFWLLYWSPN